ncbi:MAG TPA: hypothetical protein ENK22_07940 [Persephonella sp.]|nr:hypothetical protein [Persephonella sp.]
MKINILEFKVKDLFCGINTKYVKYIFEIEYVKPAPLMPPYVAGFTTYNKHIYPLICLEKVLELSEDCRQIVGKTAVTVDIDGSVYSLIVDEIYKIQEIEKTGKGDDVINFYNMQDKVLEEITPLFLKKKINLPPIKQKLYAQLITEGSSEKKEDEESFLIFNLEDKMLGINTDYVKKVEYVENLKKASTKESEWIDGVYLVRDIPVKAGNLKKLLKLEENTQPESLIIIEKENRNFGILADSITDIHTVKKSSINRGTDETVLLKDFILYKNNVVPVLSDSFLDEAVNRYALEVSSANLNQENREKAEIPILIIKIGSQRFGLKMDYVDEVVEFKEVHMSSYPTENPYVKGLIAKEKESYFLITFELALDEKIDQKAEETKIVVIKDSNLKVALLVSDVEDLLTVTEEQVGEIESEQFFIKGTVAPKDGELINLLNPKWIVYQYGSSKPVKA